MCAPPTPSRCCGSTPRARDEATMTARPRRRPRRDQERPVNLDRDAARDHRVPGLPRQRWPSTRRRGAGLPGVRPGLPGPRRHPGAAGRRGPRSRTEPRWPTYFDDGPARRRAGAGRRRPAAAQPGRGRCPGTPRGGRGGRGDRARRSTRNRDDRPRAVVAAGPDSRLLRAVLEPWCPVPFVAWPGPGPARLGRQPRPRRGARPRAAPTRPPRPRSPRRYAAAARWSSPARPTRWSPSTPPGR